MRRDIYCDRISPSSQRRMKVLSAAEVCLTNTDRVRAPQKESALFQVRANHTAAVASQGMMFVAAIVHVACNE